MLGTGRRDDLTDRAPVERGVDLEGRDIGLHVVHPRIYGSTDITVLRTSTSPGPRSGKVGRPRGGSRRRWASRRGAGQGTIWRVLVGSGMGPILAHPWCRRHLCAGRHRAVTLMVNGVHGGQASAAESARSGCGQWARALQGLGVSRSHREQGHSAPMKAVIRTIPSRVARSKAPASRPPQRPAAGQRAARSPRRGRAADRA